MERPLSLESTQIWIDQILTHIRFENDEKKMLLLQLLLLLQVSHFLQGLQLA